MATETATIRVTRKTRDLLAHLALERSISLSAMLTDIAHDMARDEVFRSERDAARADAGVLLVEAEQRERETPFDDGG